MNSIALLIGLAECQYKDPEKKTMVKWRDCSQPWRIKMLIWFRSKSHICTSRILRFFDLIFIILGRFNGAMNYPWVEGILLTVVQLTIFSGCMYHPLPILPILSDGTFSAVQRRVRHCIQYVPSCVSRRGIKGWVLWLKGKIWEWVHEVLLDNTWISNIRI